MVALIRFEPRKADFPRERVDLQGLLLNTGASG